jgi:ELWxxDGT repeat protein
MPKVVFTASNFTNGTELLVTDGTAAGTYMIRDIYPGIYSALPNIPNNIVGLGNGKALFDATNGIGFHTVDAGYGAELWVTNGTPGTRASSYRIDEGQIDAVSVRHLLSQNGGARREPQPRPEGRAGPAANRDDNVAIAAIGRQRIARDVQPDLPEGLGTNKVCVFGQQLHVGLLHCQIADC